jgi:ABC-2 type transport system permease protein
MRRLKALVVKELVQISRDISSLLICVFLPLLLLFLYGYGVSLDLDHLKIGLVLEDTSPIARTFAQSLTDSHYFNVKTVRNRASLQHDMSAGAIRGMVVVPSYFSQYIDRKEQIAPIQVIADGSETNTSNFVVNYVSAAFQNWQLQQAIAEGATPGAVVDVQSRYWFNEELDSRNFLLPGSLAIIMTLIGTLLTALVVSREWERGTMESMISTPVTVTELILGKVIPYFFLGIVSLTICLVLCLFLFEIPFRGSLLLFYLCSSIFLFCALSLGLMISTLAKNQVVAYQIALVTAFLPAYILSGFIFEIASMPGWIRFLTDFIFTKYYVQSILTIFLVGDVWEMILFNLVPMILMGTLFFAITVRHTIKRLE